MHTGTAYKVKDLLLTIHRVDPVHLFFSRLFGGHALTGGIVVGLIHVGIWIGVSRIISSNLPALTRQTREIIFFNNPDELSFGLFLWGFFVPVVWYFYLASGKLWQGAVKSLIAEGVVRENFVQILDNFYFTLLAVVISIAVGVLYVQNTIPGEIEAGRFSFWFVTSWSVAVITGMLMLNAYIFISFVLNTILMAYRVFHYFGVNAILKVKVFCEDDCGGFGAFGRLAIKFSLLAVLVGVWAVWFTLLPVLSGGQPNFSASVILLYTAYIILVPTILLSITWPIHRAMQKYKLDFKREFALRMNHNFSCLTELESPGMEDFENYNQKSLEFYEQLAVYQTINTMPEWPLATRTYRRFSRIASLPGIIGVASYIFDVIDIFGVIQQLQR